MDDERVTGFGVLDPDRPCHLVAATELGGNHRPPARWGRVRANGPAIGHCAGPFLIRSDESQCEPIDIEFLLDLL
ncbi:hypothetical protein GCM10022627_17750 [Haloarcula argentinensis]|uniref:Uncharacterized protein n=1 Tax=Haloarcula argentinensis TaxID=43776 RepID=A0A830FCA7_HALAR|nr:hypothetical protein GCM10009006_01640 [Haloarcula argentinensis]